MSGEDPNEKKRKRYEKKLEEKVFKPLREMQAKDATGGQSTLINIPEQATDNDYVNQRSAVNKGSTMIIIFRAIHTVAGTDANTAWDLKISVTNPKFELGPYKSVKSNISY
jgi:hypothetical protein